MNLNALRKSSLNMKHGLRRRSSRSQHSPGFHDIQSISSSDESSTEEMEQRPPDIENVELPPEYWQIQKLVKYLKVKH